MSSLTTLARPYAKAAFSLAQDSGQDGLTRWQGMLDLATRMVADERVAGLLDNPQVSAEKLVGILRGAGGTGFDDAFGRFLGVLGANRRLPLLAEITELFRKHKQDAEHRLQVRVVSARALEGDQAERMRAALAKRFNRDIELESVTDPDVLGGAIIYAGDEVIDGSLRGRLEKLTTALSH